MSGSALLVTGAGAIGVSIAVAVAAVAPAVRSRQGGVAGGLSVIEQQYARQAGTGGQRGPGSVSLPGWLRALALRLSPGGFTGNLQRRLDVAGNPGRWTPDRFLAVKGLGLVAFALVSGLLSLRSPGLLIICAAAGGAIGFYLPDVLLYNAGLKRQAKIRAALPDALDMLTICVEAGLGFDAALAQVARNTGGPLAAEFARALQEMQMGKSRSEALRGMVGRTTVAELRAFVSALIQSGELGISVARVLREQSREMRLRRRQRAEEKAQQVPVKITFPLITCLFPALLVIVMGPGVLQIVHTIFHKG